MHEPLRTPSNSADLGSCQTARRALSDFTSTLKPVFDISPNIPRCPRIKPLLARGCCTPRCWIFPVVHSPVGLRQHPGRAQRTQRRPHSGCTDVADSALPIVSSALSTLRTHPLPGRCLELGALRTHARSESVLAAAPATHSIISTSS